jgi:prepilin-type processing-associated H-X9-DG protein
VRHMPKGLTVVELLVVIGITSILLAILLPAIQSSREAARRCRCTCNMAEIGTALQGYTSSSGTLPPGVMVKKRFSYVYDLRKTGGYEWVYFLHYLYPYLGEESYFDAVRGPRFDLMNPWIDSSKWPEMANARRVSIILCPSDNGRGSLKGVARSFTSSKFQLTASNYLGIFSGLNDYENYSLTGLGDPANDGGPVPAKPKQVGHAVFGYRGDLRPADVADGVSNTMAVAEYLTGIDEGDMRGGFYSNRAGSQFLYVTLGPNSAAPDNLYRWHVAFCPPDGRHNCPGANLPCTPGYADFNYASPRSRHPGGVNTLRCDGSVHFVQDSIDLNAWRSLGWIGDAAAVSDD